MRNVAGNWNDRMKSCAVGSILAVQLLVTGCQVAAPSSFKTKMMEETKRHITIRGASDKNPLQATAENIHAGQANFGSYCMVCHGLDAQNTGVPFADKMEPPVPPLSSASVQAYSDGQLHWIISNGISPSGMPASKEIFHDDEIWQIVLYIRHLPAKGSLGEPEVYGGGGSAKAPEK